MFTGLIQQIGTLARRETAAGGLRLIISGAPWNPPLAPGESMTVNGVCLTIAHIQGQNFAGDILQETLDRTTLGNMRPGAALNLERALRLGDPLGGHMVSGHVDGIGVVSEAPRGPAVAGRGSLLRRSNASGYEGWIFAEPCEAKNAIQPCGMLQGFMAKKGSRQAKGRDWILRVTCGAELLRGMVLKGSIAIDGVSLTITELTDRSFAVALIPFTCEHTALGALNKGDTVNLETDLIGKHVRRTLETQQAPSPLTWERLRAAGFGNTGFGDG